MTQESPDWDTIENFYKQYRIEGTPPTRNPNESNEDWNERAENWWTNWKSRKEPGSSSTNDEKLRTAINLFRAQTTMTGFAVARKHISAKGRQDVDYERAREISNSLCTVAPENETQKKWLQDQRPEAVAFPRNAEHVSMCVRFCRVMKLEVRVRSGGHHHEGMSSGNHGVFVIRLSELNTITYPNVRKDAAWLPVGKKLENVYYELELHRRTIAGGGCQSVNMGGLTLGGGWGTSVRKYGLACDSLLEAEVVLADGTIVRANAHNNHADLFWALRGGGGGNFGIVTRFLYRLINLEGTTVVTFVHRFSYSTKDKSGTETVAARVIDNWMDFHTRDEVKDLSATIVIRKIREDNLLGKPMTIAGKYYYKETQKPGKAKTKKKKEEEAKEKTKELLCKHFFTGLPEGTINWKTKLPDGTIEWKENPIDAVYFRAPGETLSTKPADGDANARRVTSALDLDHDWLLEELFGLGPQTDLDRALSYEIQPGPPTAKTVKRPTFTCDAPHPHKVSSAFPKESKDKDKEIRKELLEWVTFKELDPKKYERARCYIALHAFGGRVRTVLGPSTSASKRPGAFPFRDKGYLLQFQSWWLEPKDEGSELYIDWVKDSRANLASRDLVEGAFLNFIDKDLPLDGHELGLLGYYYRDSDTLDCLQRIKVRYDRDNVLSFPMGVKRAGDPSNPTDYRPKDEER